MNEPQPIETAPVDTIVLTNVGIAIKPSAFTDWMSCDADGYILRNETTDDICVSPTLWIPLPTWMKP